MTTEFELTFPDEESRYLKEAYKNAACVLEYGSGGSTYFAATQTSASVLSIESDKGWASRLRKEIKRDAADPDKTRVEWIDIGPTKKWGFPQDSSKWKDYPDYVLFPWDEGYAPDVVLIDGRFRRACFAATYMLCKQPTTILFDDYTSRKVYRDVEAFLKPAAIIGRIARFEIEPRHDQSLDFATMLRWFFRPI